MGRFFATFEEAWEFFLAREEPLESFFADFPDSESYVLAWLLGFDAALVPRVRAIQEAFEPLSWITPQPAHFLHTSIALVSVSARRPTAEAIEAAVVRAREAWSEVPRFGIEYRRINCFHDAIVVEVSGGGPRELVSRLGANEPKTFLPHVTIGAFAAAADPSPLRDALVPTRETVVGAQVIREVQLCAVPASRSTILTPWEVVGRVRLD